MTQADQTSEAFVSSYLLYLLAASSDAASAQFHKIVRDKGLRVPEWRVIACLYDQDGLMTTKLADYALMEQSRLTRILDQMDQKGWVERRIDPEDRRRVRVHLTDTGKGLAKSLVEEAKYTNKNCLAFSKTRMPRGSNPRCKALLAHL